MCLIKLSFLLRQSVVRHGAQTNCLSSTEAAEYTTLNRAVKGRAGIFQSALSPQKRPGNRAF